jgi:hypothetical protein
MTVHAPHETIEVRVRRGRIGRDDWQLLCRKLGFVEASYVVEAAGVEVGREGGGERARRWTVGTLARLLVDGFRSSGQPRQRMGAGGRRSSSFPSGIHAYSPRRLSY